MLSKEIKAPVVIKLDENCIEVCRAAYHNLNTLHPVCCFKFMQLQRSMKESVLNIHGTLDSSEKQLL